MGRLEHLQPATTIYDITDDYELHELNPHCHRLVRQRERKLLQRTQQVFVTSQELQAKPALQGIRSCWIPNGVEYDLFAEASRPGEVHSLVAAMKKPVMVRPMPQSCTPASKALGIWVPRALLSFGGVGLLIDAWRFETEGNGTIQGTFTFGGVDFTVSENVQTDVDIMNVRGLMTVPVVSTDFLRISLLGGISYYDFNVTVTGATSGTGSVTAPVPVPLIGILGQAKFGPVLLEVEVSGLTFNYGDYDINYLDLQASVGVALFKIVALRAGYRLVSIDGTIEGYSIDGTLSGFFVGASVNF